MTRLVDDLLDLSAIESGRKKPRFAPVSLPALLKEVEESLKPSAKKRSVRLRLQEPGDLPDVSGDRDQLKQVFMNLVDNAIKFNKAGGEVHIEIRSNGSSVSVRVEDTGIGIPEEDLPRIFERFYRVDKARSRELGGTGLGLAIVKHIIEAHYGSVRAESRVGEGTAFFVSLNKFSS